MFRETVYLTHWRNRFAPPADCPLHDHEADCAAYNAAGYAAEVADELEDADHAATVREAIRRRVQVRAAADG